jgi:RNA polymerase sigma-70 factor, ECF subfamily
MNSEHLSKLLKQSQQGDQIAYEALLGAVVEVALPFLKSKQIPDLDQDDIIQNTLIAVHKSLPTYHPTHPVKAWLYAIIRYKLMDYFRQKYRSNAQELTEELDIELLNNSLEDDMINSERKQHLNKALTKLSAPQESIIRLMKFEGLSIKEIAQKLGLSESNVKIHAFRGYKKLANILQNSPLFFHCIFLYVLADILKKGG